MLKTNFINFSLTWTWTEGDHKKLNSEFGKSTENGPNSVFHNHLIILLPLKIVILCKNLGKIFRHVCGSTFIKNTCQWNPKKCLKRDGSEIVVGVDVDGGGNLFQKCFQILAENERMPRRYFSKNFVESGQKVNQNIPKVDSGEFLQF